MVELGDQQALLFLRAFALGDLLANQQQPGVPHGPCQFSDPYDAAVAMHLAQFPS